MISILKTDDKTTEKLFFQEGIALTDGYGAYAAADGDEIIGFALFANKKEYGEVFFLKSLAGPFSDKLSDSVFRAVLNHFDYNGIKDIYFNTDNIISHISKMKYKAEAKEKGIYINTDEFFSKKCENH